MIGDALGPSSRTVIRRRLPPALRPSDARTPVARPSSVSMPESRSAPTKDAWPAPRLPPEVKPNALNNMSRRLTKT